jgi:hypothetical protein
MTDDRTDKRLRTLALVESALRQPELFEEDFAALVPHRDEVEDALIDLLAFAVVAVESLCEELDGDVEALDFLAGLRHSLLL